jgi:excisionase family DNA binding protein
MTVKWVSVKEACRLLDISESTLRRQIKQGIIRAEGEGRERRVAIEPGAEVTATMMPNELERLRKENEELREQVAWLKQKMDQRDEQMADASQRHDTIVMQLTRQLGDAQKALEYHKAPWWRRLRLSKGKEENKV